MAHYKSDRNHLKLMFITRKSPKSEFLDIACITDDMQYYEYEMQFIQTTLTYWVCDRIMSLMADFQIDLQTAICYNGDVLTEMHPFLMYLRIVHQHILFNFKQVSFQQVVCIATEFKSKILPKDRDKSKITFKHAMRLWRALLKTRQCPWINLNADTSIMMLRGLSRKTKIILRLGAYYMVIKNKWSIRNAIGKRKRQLKSLGQSTES